MKIIKNRTYPLTKGLYVHIFHAGTKWAHGILTTNGGRVFSVAARGATLLEAISKAYDGTKAVNFDGMFYRRDIGAR